MIYELAMKAIDSKVSLKDLLLAENKIMAKISPCELDELMNPYNYIGLSEKFVDRVIGENS